MSELIQDPNKCTCDYCEQEMPIGKMYTTWLEHTVPNTEYHYGHKWCMVAFKNAYERNGRIMTQKEVEAEAFDASI